MWALQTLVQVTHAPFPPSAPRLQREGKRNHHVSVLSLNVYSRASEESVTF